MIWEATRLAVDQRGTKELYKIKEFTGRREWDKGLILAQVDWLRQDHFPWLGDPAGFYQANYLTSVGQLVPD